MWYQEKALSKRKENTQRLIMAYAKELGLSDSVVNLSGEILQKYFQKRIRIRFLDRLLAAGALYTAGSLLGARVDDKKIGQDYVARTVGTSALSVRQVYLDILKTTGVKELLIAI